MLGRPRRRHHRLFRTPEGPWDELLTRIRKIEGVLALHAGLRHFPKSSGNVWKFTKCSSSTSISRNISNQQHFLPRGIEVGRYTVDGRKGRSYTKGPPQKAVWSNMQPAPPSNVEQRVPPCQSSAMMFISTIQFSGETHSFPSASTSHL